MLYDLERGCALIDPDDLKDENDLWGAFIRANSHKATQDAVFRRLNKFIDSLQPSESSNLVWTRLAKEIGDMSDNSKSDISIVEEAIARAVGRNDSNFLKLAGLLFMITIAERKETWLSAKTKENERYDPITGKEIAWRSYWINENFKKNVDLSGLSKKFKVKTK